MGRKQKLTFNLGGRRHTLRFANLQKNDGDCDHDQREIRIARNQGDYEHLESIVHEALHGLGPQWREWWVEKSAREMAVLLWRLGYRRNDTEAEI